MDGIRSRTDRLMVQIRSDPRFVHVAHVLVRVDGKDLVDEHLRGPLSLDLFSVTKTVVALLLGIAVDDGLVRLDDTVADHLPFEAPSSLRGQTVRHLVTMTRGARTDGPWDLDAVAAGTRPWADVFAEAPQANAPGTFAYDNGAFHLLAASMHNATGGLGRFADERLFARLGITDHEWTTDPDGVPIGPTHMRMPARSLVRVGELFLDDGEVAGRRILSGQWLRAMRTPSGPRPTSPEDRAYGMGVWVEDDDTFYGAGWGGQLLLVRPKERLVVVIQTDTGFRPGPPPRNTLQPGWASPLELVRRHVL